MQGTLLHSQTHTISLSLSIIKLESKYSRLTQQTFPFLSLSLPFTPHMSNSSSSRSSNGESKKSNCPCFAFFNLPEANLWKWKQNIVVVCDAAAADHLSSSFAFNGMCSFPESARRRSVKIRGHHEEQLVSEASLSLSIFGRDRRRTFFNHHVLDERAARWNLWIWSDISRWDDLQLFASTLMIKIVQTIQHLIILKMIQHLIILKRM